MTWFRIPVFTWMSLVTAFLVLAAIPALTAAQVMLLLDRYLGTHFFDVSRGGDPLLWQHLFWYFGHPEVYIMALPAFGIISEVVPVFCPQADLRLRRHGRSGVAIAFLSVTVWAHHMFTVGLGDVADAVFGLSSMTIAVPTGIKVFSLAGDHVGRPHPLDRTPMLFALAFIVQFTIGGLSGVTSRRCRVDWQTHDTYYVVAHFHYVLGGGSLFAILAGTYYWFPKMTGRLLDERLGQMDFLADGHRLQPDVLPDAHPGPDGQAAADATRTLTCLAGARSTSSRPSAPSSWASPCWCWSGTSARRCARRCAQATTRGTPGRWSGRPPRRRPRTTSPRPAADHERPAAVGPGAPACSSRAAADCARWPPDARRARGFVAPLRMPTIARASLAFIFSEATFFGALIVAFLEYRTRSPGPGPQRPGRPAHGVLQPVPVCQQRHGLPGRAAPAHGDDRAASWPGGSASIVLGAVFLIGQVTEYLRLYRRRHHASASTCSRRRSTR